MHVRADSDLDLAESLREGELLTVSVELKPIRHLVARSAYDIKPVPGGADFTEAEIDGIGINPEAMRGMRVSPRQAALLASKLGLDVRWA